MSIIHEFDKLFIFCFTRFKIWFICLAILLLFSKHSIGQTNKIYFEPEPIRSFPGVAAIWDIVHADFNSDGLPDVAVSDGSDSVVILLNKSGTKNFEFSKPFTFAVGWEPNSLIVGDFDGDLKPDIISLNRGTEDMTFLRNISTLDIAKFSISVGNILKSFPYSIVTADFNDDGKLDLAVAHAMSDTLLVFKNVSYIGKIQFELSLEIPAQTVYTNIVVADFDNDNKIDFATCGVDIYRNTSSDKNITFSKYPSIQQTNWSMDFITPSDLDHDGKVDFVAYKVLDGIYFIKNNSTPGNLIFDFDGVHYTDVLKPFSLETADLNGDLKEEIILTNPGYIGFVEPRTSNGVNIITNTSNSGNISFSIPSLKFSLAESPYASTFADFDLDGLTDIAIACSDAASVSFLLNRSSNGTLNFPLPYKFEVGDTPLFINGEDFDNDGKKDLVTVDRKGEISVLRNISTVGNILFDTYNQYNIGKEHSFLKIADFDKDGKPDIAAAGCSQLTEQSTGISILQNISSTGQINFALKDTLLYGETYSMDIADIDGDGNQDIIAGCSRTINHNVWDTLFVIRNTSANNNISFSNPKAISSIGDPYGVIAADFNDDGKLDIAINNDDNHLEIYLNESTPGNIALSSKIILDVPYSKKTFVYDIDGDNKIDLVDLTQYGVNLFLNTSSNGNISFDPAVIIGSPFPLTQRSFLETAYLTDLTGDSKPDLVLGCSAGQFTIWENQSTPGNVTFTPSFSGFIVLGNTNFYIEDLDGDGKKEIVSPQNDWAEVDILRTSKTQLPTSVPLIEYNLENYSLDQNYPNPFNSSTTINYFIPENSFVTLKICDILGHEVITLINKQENAGNYSVIFNGSILSNGVYLCTIKANKYYNTKKIILMK
jgi:hypothetical protein